ncbi:hypothetical protein PBY51_019703 [Eleginops maclovinus]|uniref:lysozyme n=1 Tax=Eleginops maclovinus TaxID=56733 RepID=A0AAN8ASG6_ELEMC|nr:hypothetical protein PBY51_019703 [Eleginops maclovinus]
MRVFVCLFLLSALGCGLAEGRVVSKCELRQLFKELPVGSWPKGQEMTDNLLAKILCHVEKASGFNTSSVNLLTPSRKHQSSSEEEEEEEEWTLYGLFQLSDHLVCSSGATLSPNRICEVFCSDLLDDDIQDDISCVLKLIGKLLENGSRWRRKGEFMRMVKLLFQPDCNHPNPDYFNECQVA